MRLIQATTLALGLLDLAVAQISPPIYCICPNGLICTGNTPQCTPDRTNGTQATCCASGQMAIRGNCVDANSQLCSDGETICSGADSHCAVDTEGKSICCARGQIAGRGECLNAGSRICSDGETVCSGSQSQCTIDSSGKSICCARGQIASKGRCIAAGSQLCADGKTTCSGSKSQCTVDVNVWADDTGAGSGKHVCCAPGSKSINGQCYPGNSKVMPCYRSACNWPDFYCAWNAGNADSRCCRLDEYYAGNSCVQKR